MQSNRRNCKDIVAGNPTKIVQVYVESPLIWDSRCKITLKQSLI
jgi:hypothetical protein